MPTLVVRKDGGGDHTSLSAAVAAAAAGDTISIEQWDTSYDGGGIAVGTANLTIQVAAGARHPGHVDGAAGYYRISHGGDHVFTVNADGLTLDGLEIMQAGTGSSDEGIRMAADGGMLTVRDCIIWADSATSDQDGIYAGGIACTVNVVQCIIHGFARGGLHAQIFSGAPAQTWNVNSCSIWNCGRAGGEADGGGFAARADQPAATVNANVFNSWLLGNDGQGSLDLNVDTAQTNGTVAWTVDRCIYGSADASVSATDSLSGAGASDSASPGAGTWVIARDITTSPYDLRLLDAADNAAQDAHADGGGAGLTMPTADIVGTGRPQTTDYDIGAFEIAAGGGGTVGTGLALAYAVRAAAGGSLAAVWDLRGQAAATTSLRWHLRQALGRGLDLDYAVRRAAGAVAALRWDLRAPARDDLAVAWALRQSVGDNLATSWDLRTLAGGGLQALWDILADGIVGADLALCWETVARQAVDLEARWSVRAAAGAELTAAWSVAARAGDDAPLRWSVRQGVGASSDPRWRVAGSVADVLATAWQLRGLAGGTLDPRWSIVGQVGDTLELRWTLGDVGARPALQVLVMPGRRRDASLAGARREVALPARTTTITIH